MLPELAPASGLDPGPLLALPLAAALTWGLARWARRRGFLDGARGELRVRKLQSQPVPPVGGLALFLTLACLPWLLGMRLHWTLPFTGGQVLLEHGVLLAVGGLVLLAGLWDDLLPGGLGPLAKLSALGLALLPLVLGALDMARVAQAGWAGALGPLGFGLLLWGAALAALNVFNTFDNADGACTGVASLGFLPAALAAGSEGSPAALLALAACLGFLPWNLNAKPAPGSAPASATPSAYLGDAGAFLLALLLLLVPGAWCALWIPGLDLARLSVVRWRQGSRPWVGDRRHLAHRLQRAGCGPRQVLGLLCLLSLPACLGPALLGQGPGALAAGLVLSALGFLLALVWTRGVAEGA